MSRKRPSRAPAVVVRPRWARDAGEVTPEEVFLRRREFLATLGLGASGLWLGCGSERSAAPGRAPTSRAPTPRAARGGAASGELPPDVQALYPAPRSPRFRAERALTPPDVAGRYNNFYEFTTDKERVHELAAGMRTHPWQVEVTGLVHRPRVFDVDELQRRMPLEERVYRFRCVEAWAMVVPWTGFPLRALLAQVEPTSAARFVRFVSVHDPQLPGVRSQPWYPWPYFEGLRIDEAMNELTLLATGIYGRPLPPQHGAPLRLVVPWKYGFKSIKSLVRIELVAERPATFWNQLQPAEYGFYANVDPHTPHPRWSQATERLIDTGARVPTRVYNGYGELVADLYPGGPSRPA